MKINQHIILFGLLWIISPIQAQLSIKENQEGIKVLEDLQPVLFFQTAAKDVGNKYERTNYIHPLWNVDGTILTEDSPADHLHHRGIFWAWHQIIIDGERIGDGWALEDFNQEVVRTEWELNNSGTGTLSNRVLWSSDLYTVNKKPDPYIQEDTKITVHPKKDNYRKIDFVIRLSALQEPVSIGGSEDDKGYSGFSVRMKLPEDVGFDGPKGALEPQRTAVESPGFVKVSGTIDGDHAGGILISDHPKNPGYPQSWILRSKNSMQNAKYPGHKPVKIDPESPLVLRYSLVTYTGKLSDIDIKNVLK